MVHYVYRITNIINKKHYYGVRTCKNTSAVEDLGIKYFSSSSDHIFMEEQKNKPLNFKYKIVKILKTRYLAEQLESKLHKKLNVSNNDNFYNRCNATENGFSVLGKISVKDLLGNNIGLVNLDNPKVLSGEWVHHSTGMMTVTLISTNKKIRISSEDYNREIHFFRDGSGKNNINYNHKITKDVLLKLAYDNMDTIIENNTYLSNKMDKIVIDYINDLKVFKKIIKTTRIIYERFGSTEYFINEFNTKYNLSIIYNKNYRSTEQRQKLRDINLGKVSNNLGKLKYPTLTETMVVEILFDNLPKLKYKNGNISTSKCSDVITEYINKNKLTNKVVNSNSVFKQIIGNVNNLKRLLEDYKGNKND